MLIEQLDNKKFFWRELAPRLQMSKYLPIFGRKENNQNSSNELSVIKSSEDVKIHRDILTLISYW